ELVGIEEEELYAFIRALPNRWEQESGTFDPSMTLLLHRYHESESSVFGVNLYKMGYFLLTLFVEYYRNSGLAIIEVHVLLRGSPQPKMEQKIRNIILNVTEKDLERLAAIPRGGVFICPFCQAQYSLRVLKIEEDGRIKCQNCGRLIDLSIKSSDNEIKEQG
ncbi:MAG: hypothetical protein ACXACT_14160, partial [Candidatus Thorarchaeota archaeon]